jgi:hypothetical protein
MLGKIIFTYLHKVMNFKFYFKYLRIYDKRMLVDDRSKILKQFSPLNLVNIFSIDLIDFLKFKILIFRKIRSVLILQALFTAIMEQVFYSF